MSVRSEGGNEQDEQVAGARRRYALVVVNPKAGGAAPDELRHLAYEVFTAAGWRCECQDIGPREALAAALARARREGVDLVVAAGGDGTVATVAHDLVGSGVPLGILPVGTGNMLSRDLGIPQDLTLALALLAGDHAIAPLDGMKIGDRYYFLNAEIGLAAAVMGETPPEQKRKLGMLAYVLTLLGKVFSYRSSRFSLTIDGVSRRMRADAVLIANAGLLRPLGPEWASQISPADGALDLIVWRVKGLHGFLRLAWELFKGVESSPVLYHGRVSRSARVAADRALPVQADGEALGLGELDVEVVPSAIRVAVPLAEAMAEGAKQRLGPEARQAKAWQRQERLARELGPVGRLDTALFLAVNSLPHPPALDLGMRLLSAVMSKGMAWAAGLILVALLDGRQGWRAVRDVLPAMWLAGLTVEYPVKRLFGRMRPFRALALSSVVGPKPTGYSFPSAHSAVAFTAARLISVHYPKRTAALYALASLVGFSRLYLGVHYTSDVLVGALTGFILAPISRLAIKRLSACRDHSR